MEITYSTTMSLDRHDRDFISGVAVWDAEILFFRDAWSVGGVYIYKTKGTVLVFSWCGSGSIMPQKDLERERQK